MPPTYLKLYHSFPDSQAQNPAYSDCSINYLKVPPGIDPCDRRLSETPGIGLPDSSILSESPPSNSVPVNPPYISSHNNSAMPDSVPAQSLRLPTPLVPRHLPAALWTPIHWQPPLRIHPVF